MSPDWYSLKMTELNPADISECEIESCSAPAQLHVGATSRDDDPSDDDELVEMDVCLPHAVFLMTTGVHVAIEVMFGV